LTLAYEGAGAIEIDNDGQLKFRGYLTMGEREQAHSRGEMAMETVVLRTVVL
jgi:hypothetical protein